MAKDVRGDLLLLGRGKVSFNRKNADGTYQGELFLGNCPDFSSGISDDRKIKRSSATAAAPIIADALISRDMTFGITLDEWDHRNIALGLMGAVGALAQEAMTDVAYEPVGGVKQGYWYQMKDENGVDVRRLTALSATVGTLGTDFLVDAEGGRAYIVAGGAIADDASIEFTFSAAADDSIVISAGSDAKIEGFLRFVSDPAIGPFYEAKLWNVSLTPDGDVAFIGDDFGSFKLKCTVKDDSANHPDFPLGQVIKRTTPEGSGGEDELIVP